MPTLEGSQATGGSGGWGEGRKPKVKRLVETGEVGRDGFLFFLGGFLPPLDEKFFGGL